MVSYFPKVCAFGGVQDELSDSEHFEYLSTTHHYSGLKPFKGLKHDVAFYSALTWGYTILRKAIEQLLLSLNLQH